MGSPKRHVTRNTVQELMRETYLNSAGGRPPESLEDDVDKRKALEWLKEYDAEWLVLNQK